MTSHREILRGLLAAKQISFDKAAARMGWKSPRTVSMKLAAKRDWATGELARMCKIAGITLVQLADMSDDFVLTRTREALETAKIADDLGEDDRAALLEYARQLERKQTLNTGK